jgi:hypothetical protein
MKLAIMCQSLLLEKALTLFLKPYIVPLKQCDFVVSDYKIAADVPQFKIKTPDSDLIFPFSKSALLIALDKFSKTLEASKSKAKSIEPKAKSQNFKILEEKLNQICNQYNAQIIQAIKEHYGE